MEIPAGEVIRLNIGGGTKRYGGWLNVDIREDADIVSDVRAIPVPDHYADEAMAIHILEHLWRWEAVDVLKEWRRVLKPGGMLAVEVPDLVKISQWIARGELLGAQRGLHGDEVSKEPPMTHRWTWHAQELVLAMKEAGFSKVRVLEPIYHKRSRDMRVQGLA